MTPKVKAIELVDKYLLVEDTQSKIGGNLMFKNEAKICALIAVDEILYLDSGNAIDKGYWQEVKQEIENL